jgi:G8 domain/Viral BACON domain
MKDEIATSQRAFGLASALLVALATAGVDSRVLGAISQTHTSHGDVKTTAEGSVTADRVLIGAEYVPRRNDLANTLVVPSRQTVELPADATYDYIEVAGTLRVSRVHDTTLRFTHLVILPDATLDVGTQADPIPCTRKVEFIVRDVPIDTAKDPFQWGNGLVNFGHQTRVGCSKTAWAEAAGSITAGATTVVLGSAPSGWQVGDEVLIPDTAPPPAATITPRREARVTISAINGTQLDLSKPLDFAHQNITDPNGVVVLRPRVANLTRNVVIRSETPDSTPGHTADVGQKATWDIRYNQLSGLGRTSRVPFDDTVLGSHIGTNQRGKYAEHHHHVQSAPTSADVGNVYIGHPKGKWGLVVHVTSDTLVEQNVAVDFPGAAFVTEDGYEARNIFRRNFAAYNLGRTRDAQGSFFDAAGNVTRNCPGCEGTGFWLRGVMNAFEGNEAWNNFFSGMNLFNQMQPAGQYPSVRGGKPDTSLKHFEDRPVSMNGNVVAANGITGLELWGVQRFPIQDLVAANNANRQVFAVISDGVHVYLQNPKAICTVGTGAIGIHSSAGYVSSFEISHGQIAGCATGIGGQGSASGMTVSGTIMQNEVNIDALPRNALFDGVMHVPLANYPVQYIRFDRGAVWNGTDPLPNPGTSYWFPQRGSRYVVKNWQGTGEDYLLFYRQSLAGNPAWYSAAGQHSFNTPVQGLTMQQSWDTYGLGYGGDVLEESEAVQLDGLVNGLARKGLGVHYGPPRAIVTFPTMREKAVVEGDVVRIFGILTGDPSAASPVMMASVDGDRPIAYDKGDMDDRSFTTTHVSPGTHEVKVWRTQKGNPKAVIPESEFTARYCVGACPSIPHGHITLSADSLTFTGTPEGPVPASKQVTLSNTGGAAMNWAVRSDQKSCDVSRYNGRLEAGASTTFSVSVKAPSGGGSFVCKVTVSDYNADNTPQTITINHNVSGQPES